MVKCNGRSLDEVADGKSPWASSIRKSGTVIAAVVRPEGRLGIRRLMHTGPDGDRAAHHW